MSLSVVFFLLALVTIFAGAAVLASRIDGLLCDLPASARRAYRQSRWD